MRVSTKMMSFDKEVFTDATITNAINEFLGEEDITPDMLIDVKMMGTDKITTILVIYKEY